MPRLNLSVLANSQPVYILKIVGVYALCVVLLVLMIDEIGAAVGFPDTVSPAFREVALIIGIGVIWSAWISSAASPNDRQLVILRLFWIFMPYVVVTPIAWVAHYGFGSISYIQLGVVLILTIFITILWSQIINPVLRSRMYRRAHDYEGIYKAEERLYWPGNPQESEDVEIRIPPEKYFSLLAGVGALIFIVLETILSEFIGDVAGTNSYGAASVIAVGIAALMYPIHMVSSRKLDIGRSKIAAPEEASDESLIKNVARQSAKNYRLIFVKYWYLPLLGLIIGALLGKLDPFN